MRYWLAGLILLVALPVAVFAQAIGGKLNVLGTSIIENLRFSSQNDVSAQSSCFQPVSGCAWNITNLVGSLVPASQSGAISFTVDIGTTFTVAMDARHPTIGLSTASLSTQITSAVDADVKDKIFFDAVPSAGTYYLPVSGTQNERFVSFDMMLATPYDPPNDTQGGTYYIIHFQSLQCCGGHPPLELAVDLTKDNTQSVFLYLGVRDDTTANAALSTQIANFSVARDTWFHVTLDLQPSPDGLPAGKVIAWVNGSQIVNYSGNWGYVPAALNPNLGVQVLPQLQLDIGTYRRRQVSTQTVLIANFKYAYTLGGV